MRHRAKVDANQEEIVKALRSMGATVQSLATIGKGCPDILVGFRRKNVLFEIKDGSLAPSKRQLTDDEKRWQATWAGQCKTIGSAEEAILWLVAITQ